MTTTHDLDKTLHRVQALIAKADSTDSPEEADALRTHAEALMLKYRIDETMLGSSSTGTAVNAEPVWRTIRVYPTGNEFSEAYQSLLGYCLRHVDCRSRFKAGFARDEDGTTWREVEAVGYDSDLRYAEMLFTSFALAFAGKMEPKVNPALSDAENAYAMRSAGMEGWRIARELWLPANTPARDVSKALRSKARRLFAQVSEQRGEDASVLLGQGNSVKVYRESYADGFVDEAYSRLTRMKMSNGESGALVLKSRKDAVTEAWYTRFPDLRPNPKAWAGNQLGGRDTCEKCKRASSGYCREHAWMKPTQARGRVRASNSAGSARGRAAAQSVNLGGSAGSRVATESRKEIG